MTPLEVFATLTNKFKFADTRDRFTPNTAGPRTALKTWVSKRKDKRFDSLTAYYIDGEWKHPYAPANRQIEVIKSKHLIWSDGSRLEFVGKCLYSDDKLWIGVCDDWYLSLAVCD